MLIVAVGGSCSGGRVSAAVVIVTVAIAMAIAPTPTLIPAVVVPLAHVLIIPVVVLLVAVVPSITPGIGAQAIEFLLHLEFELPLDLLLRLIPLLGGQGVWIFPTPKDFSQDTFDFLELEGVGFVGNIPYPPGYSQYQNNLPFTPSYSVAGKLDPSDLPLANPPPIHKLPNCTNCVDNYNHFTGKGFSSRGH